jgi:DNA-binding CsgD family transcriptional regulator
MGSKLKASGMLFGVIFFTAAGLNAVTTLLAGKESLADIFLDFSYIDSLIAISALMFLSAYLSRLAWLQPAIMLALAPLPTWGNIDSFFGLGFFVTGVLLLLRLGFYDRLRGPKIACSIGYLIAIEVLSAIKNKEGPFAGLVSVFFIIAFIGFLLLTFRDKIFVYLREPKPILSLEEKGLSVAEQVYVRAILVGRGVKEVAFESGVSESTVRNTLARAYKKLEVVNRSGLISLAQNYDVR